MSMYIKIILTYFSWRFRNSFYLTFPRANVEQTFIIYSDFLFYFYFISKMIYFLRSCLNKIYL